MLFNSIAFLVFIVVVLIGYSLLRNQRLGFLLLASYFFYGWWNWSYLGLIVLSTLVDYYAGKKLSQSGIAESTRKFYLGCSVSVNLGILFFFKYFNFFNGELGKLFEWMGMNYLVPYADFLLPMGVSFYTFQTLSYTIDIYNRKIEPELHLGRFALFVSFFPQLVAGPIERAGHLIGQLKKLEDIKYRNFVIGMNRVAFGLLKKVVIADRLALFVNQVYGDVYTYDGFILLIATFFFAFQIYCDFSGYSDIAIGLAKMFGIDLMENFRNPYLAYNIRDFWARWHISLSTWFRDYVYIPLGGNKQGLYRNILIVFLVSGLWHGANWTFIVWGGLHGLLLLFTVITLKWMPLNRPWMKYIGVLVTFLFVCLAWIFFRANTIEEANYVLKSLPNWNRQFVVDIAYQLKFAISNPSTLMNALNLDFSRINFQFSVADMYISLLLLPLLIGLEYVRFSSRLKDKFPRELGIVLMGLVILLFGVFSSNQFIYFQF